MIIKVLGSIIVICCASAMGCIYANRDKYKMEELIEMQKFLSILKSEIDFSSSSLPEAISNIRTKVIGEVKVMLDNFYEKLSSRENEDIYNIWSECLKKSKEKSYFDNEDYEQFLSFGKSLGYLDKQLQISNIKITMDYIENKIHRLEKSFNNNKKMYQSTGILCGLLIIIILI